MSNTDEPEVSHVMHDSYVIDSNESYTAEEINLALSPTPDSGIPNKLVKLRRAFMAAIHREFGYSCSIEDWLKHRGLM